MDRSLLCGNKNVLSGGILRTLSTMMTIQAIFRRIWRQLNLPTAVQVQITRTGKSTLIQDDTKEADFLFDVPLPSDRNYNAAKKSS